MKKFNSIVSSKLDGIDGIGWMAESWAFRTKPMKAVAPLEIPPWRACRIEFVSNGRELVHPMLKSRIIAINLNFEHLNPTLLGNKELK